MYNQDNLQLRLTSADQYNTTSIARITINDDLYSFYVTTKEEPTNTGSDDTDLTGTFVDYNTGETVETETGDLIEGSTGDLIETDTDTTSITGDLEAPILETMTVLGSGNTIMLSGTMNEPSKIGVYYTGENITGEYFSGNEYTTGLQIQLENIVLDTKYQFDIILKDSGDNRSHWTGMRKLLSGDIVETGSRAETGTATNITNSEKYREIFKNELKQYQQCKKTIASQKITMHIQNKNYSIEVPEFQSEFLANISSIFSRIILQAVEQQNLSQQETKEVLDNFSNFLMVMKILRDGDTDCSHHLSNYYITKFHESLAEYGVFLK